MNKAKPIIVCGVVAIMLSVLFPPWLFTVNSSVHSEKDAGYAFLLTPPAARSESAASGIKLDISRLVLEWVAIAATGAVAWLVPFSYRARSRSCRIIMLDDDNEILKMAEVIVRQWSKKAAMLAFQDGEAAWKALLFAAPDLLIMDWNRPSPNGPEFLSRLAERRVRYPIIVASGSAGPEDIRDFSSRGLKITLLSKPYTAKQLYAELSRLFGPGYRLK